MDMAVNINGKEYLTMQEAASVTGLKYGYIRKLIAKRDKRLRCIRVDKRTTLVLADDVKEFAATKRSKGRPRKKKA